MRDPRSRFERRLQRGSFVTDRSSRDAFSGEWPARLRIRLHSKEASDGPQVAQGFTFANVCSFLAFTIALGTGTAYAADTVFSADIVDGEVKSADLGGNSVGSGKITDNKSTHGRARRHVPGRGC